MDPIRLEDSRLLRPQDLKSSRRAMRSKAWGRITGMANRGETAPTADEARLVASHAAEMLRSRRKNIALLLGSYAVATVFVVLQLPAQDRPWISGVLVVGFVSLLGILIRSRPRWERAVEGNLAILD